MKFYFGLGARLDKIHDDIRRQDVIVDSDCAVCIEAPDLEAAKRRLRMARVDSFETCYTQNEWYEARFRFPCGVCVNLIAK